VSEAPHLVLVDVKEWSTAGRSYRWEQWSLTGGEIHPSWQRDASAKDWKPSCRFTLWLHDGVVDPRLGSYGGDVWPTAWPDLFCPLHQQGDVEITKSGLQLREEALP
jgi:hypothetical protein